MNAWWYEETPFVRDGVPQIKLSKAGRFAVRLVLIFFLMVFAGLLLAWAAVSFGPWAMVDFLARRLHARV